MNLLRKLRSSVRHWLRRAELERSLQDEMQLHIELYEADLHKTTRVDPVIALRYE